MEINSTTVNFVFVCVVSVCISCWLQIQVVVSHTKEPKKLLLISLDGFRWDYLDKLPGKVPNFEKFKKEGGYARKGSKNVFMTLTAPNHYSLVTGLYSESHGILSNYIYDPVLNSTYSLFNTTQQYESKWFDNGGEPIWVTNQLQNSHHRTGAIFWPGSWGAVNGVVPTRLYLAERLYYDTKDPLPFRQRIDLMMKWFANKYPINLGLLYSEEPDEIGHKFGPDSEEVKEAVLKLDDDLGYLLDLIEKSDLTDDINIILTADHGMSYTPDEKIINLDDFVDFNRYKVFGVSPVCSILPNEGEKENIYNILKEKSKENGHFDVYYKEDIPTEYHYKNNVRVTPILVVAHNEYTFLYNRTDYTNHTKGQHGYNNSVSNMHPIFMVKGPSFIAGASIETLNSVDIYPLMCHLLNLEPAPNNGSLDMVQDLLKENEQYTLVTFIVYIGVSIFIALVSGIFVMATCRQHRNMKRKQRQMVQPGGVQFSTLLQREANLPLLSDSEEGSI